MDPRELRPILKDLGLPQRAAARLPGVKPRAAQRRAVGAPAVGEPAARALLAWHRLAECGLPRRPDRVAARGGLTLRRRVNPDRRHATTEEISAIFNPVAGGLFAPAGYRWYDRPASRDLAWPPIEQAMAAFAQAVQAASARWLGDGKVARRSPRAAGVLGDLERAASP